MANWEQKYDELSADFSKLTRDIAKATAGPGWPSWVCPLGSPNRMSPAAQDTLNSSKRH